MHTPKTFILALGAILLAASLALAPAQARPKPKPQALTTVILETTTQSEVSGRVAGTEPCGNLKRKVVLYQARGAGPAKPIARLTTAADGTFSFVRELNNRSIYQVAAPVLERRRFVCRSATTGLFGFLN